jgi:hypothetical protein
VSNSLVEIVPDNPLSVLEYREWITSVEKRIQATGVAFDRHDEGTEPTHMFTPGLYTRQLFMPKGLIVISRIHMFEHPFVISKGDVSVYDGDRIIRVTAPYQGVTKPGTKRILYTHEDTIWTTFHVTDKTSLEEVDVDGVITCDTFEQYDDFAKEVLTWHG